MMLSLRQSEQNPQPEQIWPVSQVTKSVNRMSVHREHVKLDVDSAFKENSSLFFYWLSVDIGMLSISNI